MTCGDHDERLAERRRVSKQKAISRAIRKADIDIILTSDERADAYSEALDRLGSV